MLEAAAVYLTVINLISCIVCCLDKRRAVNRGRRIRERTLLLLSVLGGSIAMYITMRVIRHKTRHRKFMLGIPLIILFQLILIAGIIKTTG